MMSRSRTPPSPASTSTQTNPLDTIEIEAHELGVLEPKRVKSSKGGKEKGADAETTVSVQEVTEVEVVEVAVSDFPDGGLRAWLVVLGTAMAGFSTFGFVNSWGIFQAFYEETLLKGTPPSTIAWIGSLQYALVFFPALVTGYLFDIGIFKIPFFIASLIIIACCFITAQCYEYWHFLLCQGILLGTASGFVFGPSMAIIGHWFKKKRGIALGLTAAGSSIGGTCLPIACRLLIEEVGFQWTMRIIGFIQIFTLAIPNLTLARRLPPKKADGILFDYRVFKSPAFSVYCIAIWSSFLGLYTALTYIDISAQEIGVSPNFTFYLVAITNAASGFGRLFTGAMIDRYGAINFYAPMTAVAGALTYAWPFARTEGQTIAIAVLYGFASGAFISAFIVPVIAMGGMNDIGRRTGTVMSIAAVGALLGPPISGAIEAATGGFHAVGFYAGSTIMFSVFLMFITRYLVLGQWRGRY